MRNHIVLIILIIIAICFSIPLILNHNTLQENAHTTFSTSQIKDYSGIYISEVAPNNKSIIKDETLLYQNYIEIYNSTNEPINLLGVGLSNNTKFPFQWTFPDIAIEPAEYIIIFADGEDYFYKYLHANFELNAKGNIIVLTSPNGDNLSKVHVKQCLEDMTYCYYNDGYAYASFGSPLYASNKRIDEYDVYLAESNDTYIEFSHKAGFYENPFELELYSNSKYTIRYTFDGSNPTWKSTKYTSPILIDTREKDKNIFIPIQTTFNNYYIPPDEDTKRINVIKAQCFIDTQPVGDVVTNTYIVDEKNYDLFSTPVISLCVEPDDFWSGYDGLYVPGDRYIDDINNMYSLTQANYHQRGKEWRRPCNIEYFVEGQRVLEKDLGVQIFGGSSRGNPKKSLKFVTNDFADTDIMYSFFDDATLINNKDIESFDSIVLRGGASEDTKTMIRDVIASDLGSSVMKTQAAKAVTLFINGEYYGLFFIRETLDEHFIKNNYGTQSEQVAFIKSYRSDKKSDLEDLYEYIDLAKELDKLSEHNFEIFKKAFDTENMIEYYVLQMYLKNTDWPVGNSALWRTEHNGEYSKYKHALFDVDISMDLEENTNVFEKIFLAQGESLENATAIIRYLIKDELFLEEFICTFCDRLNDTYSPENVERIIDFRQKELQSEIEKNILRYGLFNLSVQGWFDEIQSVRDFFSSRTDIVFAEMAACFDREIKNIDVQTSYGGCVYINDKICVQDKPFEGRYLTDITIQMKAIPDNGYKFVAWSNGETNDTIMIKIENEIQNTQYKAIFEKVDN